LCLQGINALMRAAQNNAEAAVDYLLLLRADVNRQDEVAESSRTTDLF
jgi:ankyrin repeat protein